MTGLKILTYVKKNVKKIYFLHKKTLRLTLLRKGDD